MEELERELLKKLIDLTQQGRLAWHFEGDAKKICVALYRDTQLKLFAKKLELADHNGDAAIIDAFVSDSLTNDLESLVHVARKAAGHYPTCEIKAVVGNSFELYNRLLQD